jgi:4-oxalocrotonate tautomerase
MPCVTIQITREGVTAEQKAALIRGATELLVRVLDKDPALTFVLIDEVETDNWGVAGQTVTALRRQQAAARPPVRPPTDPREAMNDPFVQVSAVLDDYFEGLYRSDSQMLRRVFHPSALYACATDGTLLTLRMDEYFAIVDKRPSPASRGDPRTDRIVGIEFAGPVTALARVECSILPKHFIDLLTLVQVDGRWQVISKVFHYALAPPSVAS